jgi:ABC-2 type transport system ATP-binding protein
MTNLVTVSRLSKHFGDIQAVRDLSFEVAEGEVLGFLGPNGAGKSTTMKMITGFLEPDAGDVEVAGQRLSASPVAVKRSIGYLPEGAPLYGDMTTLSFLRFIGAMRGISGASLAKRIDQVVGMINLESVLHQSLDTLSKGFKRRVGLAQAIFHDPPVLILDEPTDGLDPNQKHEVRALITSMAPRKAIVLSTHILEEVEAVCTRAMIIASGSIVADSTPAELAARAVAGNAWLVEATGAEALDALREALAARPWVGAVEEVTGEAPLLRVTADDPVAGAALGRSLAEWLGEGGPPVAQFYRERGRLDDVFRDITNGANVLS